MIKCPGWPEIGKKLYFLLVQLHRNNYVHTCRWIAKETVVYSTSAHIIPFRQSTWRNSHNGFGPYLIPRRPSSLSLLKDPELSLFHVYFSFAVLGR